MLTTEHQQQNKRIKWAKSFSPAGRLQKRASATKPKPKPKPPLPIKTTGDHQQKPLSLSGTGVDRKSEIQGLENELGYSVDTLATISVMYNSILHAYHSSKSELDRTRNDTRLGEMEKELLTAYDDIVLQVTHLQCRIGKVEKRLSELSAEALLPSPQPSLVSDRGGNESPLSALSYNATPPALLWPDEMMFMRCSPAILYQQPQQQQQQELLTHHYHGQPHQQEPRLSISPWGSIYLHS